jgi:hypothetical protein
MDVFESVHRLTVWGDRIAMLGTRYEEGSDVPRSIVCVQTGE